MKTPIYFEMWYKDDELRLFFDANFCLVSEMSRRVAKVFDQWAKIKFFILRS